MQLPAAQTSAEPSFTVPLPRCRPQLQRFVKVKRLDRKPIYTAGVSSGASFAVKFPKIFFSRNARRTCRACWACWVSSAWGCCCASRCGCHVAINPVT